MRVAVLACVSVAISCSAFASEPGERLTWDDFSFEIPGLYSESFLPPLEPADCSAISTPDVLRCGRLFALGSLDAEGNFYFTVEAEEREEIWRTRKDGVTELVAHLPKQRENGNTLDLASLGGLYVDLVNGSIYARLSTQCFPSHDQQCAYSAAREIVRISGLKLLRKVLHGRPQRID